jgi:hypothetical protein
MRSTGRGFPFRNLARQPPSRVCVVGLQPYGRGRPTVKVYRPALREQARPEKWNLLDEVPPPDYICQVFMVMVAKQIRNNTLLAGTPEAGVAGPIRRKNSLLG